MTTHLQGQPRRRANAIDGSMLARVAAALAIGLGLCVASQRASAQVEQWAPGVAVNLSHGILGTDTGVAPSSVGYQGRKERKVYDRRVSKNITINAYVFKVTWPNGATAEGILNPEFGSSANARQALDQFLPAVGRLPFCLRSKVDELVIHKGDEAYGGGGNGLLLYAGRARYGEPEYDEIVVHEAAHNLGQQIQDSQAWKNAQSADKAQDGSGRQGYISVYARDNPSREDVSESFLAWLLLRKRNDRLSAGERAYIEGTIPNRLQYFDAMACNTHPVGL
ncbi:MAG: hypothetical protein LCH70_00140 [Proteobacteria bacterium]|nr:hypothetical protein [Pseudomonadota bacterium]